MELPWSIIHVSLQHKSGIHFILIALFDGLKRCCFLERHFYEPKFGQHAELKRERYFRGKTAINLPVFLQNPSKITRKCLEFGRELHLKSCIVISKYDQR